MDCSPPGFSVHGISQARILEWGCHFLLQGIFLTQGSNTHLLHWPTDSLPMSHQGSRARDDTPFLVSSREFIFEIWCCLGEIQGCPLSNGIWISFAGSGSSQHWYHSWRAFLLPRDRHVLQASAAICTYSPPQHSTTPMLYQGRVSLSNSGFLWRVKQCHHLFFSKTKFTFR